MQRDTQVVMVDGIGSFVCRRRTMRVAIAISAEYNRLTEGADNIGPEFAGICNFMAYLRAMVVSGPDNWAPYDIDPEDNDAMDELRKVYMAIKDAEARFRKKPGSEPQGASPGVSGVD